MDMTVLSLLKKTYKFRSGDQQITQDKIVNCHLIQYEYVTFLGFDDVISTVSHVTYCTSQISQSSGVNLWSFTLQDASISAW